MLEQKWRQEAVVDFIKLALAALLILTPWIFGFTSAPVASGNAWVSGAVIGLASIAAIVTFAEWQEWLSLVFGLWVAISPWVLNFHASLMSAMRADVTIGILVALFAAADLWMMRHTPPHMAA